MYIVLEGIDGAGKSTQIKLLKEWLENNGLKVETVVEPTDFEVGKLIRELLTRSDATSDTMQKTLGLLFAADRLILMDKIEKLESENTVVISDRSFYSSLVYQKPQEWIKELIKFQIWFFYWIWMSRNLLKDVMEQMNLKMKSF